MRAQRIGRILRKGVESKVELRNAKKAISEMEKLFGKNGENWTQGAMYRGENQMCLLGAVQDAAAEGLQRDIVFTAIRGAIPGERVRYVEDFASYDYDVVNFNDAAEREFKSIKEVLKRAKKAIGFAISGEKR